MEREVENKGFVKEIVSAAFPEYKGRTVTLSTSVPTTIRSYWDGGSRDYYAFVELATKRVMDVPSNHPFYDQGVPDRLKQLPVGVALLKRPCFCGKWLRVRLYVREENLTPMLPPVKTVELTSDELSLLGWTDALKPFARRSEAEYHGWSTARYDETKRSLQEKGLLAKSGAITMEGENVLHERKPR